MKLSHVFAGVGIGVFVSIAVGALLFIFFAPKPHILNGPDDLPVLARGGSMDALSKTNKWSPVVTQPCSGVFSSSSVNPVNLSAVSMDGLELITYPSGKRTLGPAESVNATTLTKDWSITFNMRDKDDVIDSNIVLQLSTYDPCNGTAKPGATSIKGGTLYLADIGSTNLDFDRQYDEDNDSSYRLRFDVKKCDGDVHTKDAVHSRCNHISQVTVSGIPSLQGSSSGSILSSLPIPFQCRGGACDIGLDNQ